MNKIKVIAATVNDKHDPFTRENLESLKNTAKGVPVLFNFNDDQVIGEVTGAEINDDGLLISADINFDKVDGGYLVPGFLFPGHQCVSIGLTDNPKDETLPKISS